MKAVVEKENLNCDFHLTRSLEVILSSDMAVAAKATYEEQLTSGLDFIEDVAYIGSEYAERFSGVQDAKAAISTTAAQLWPYKFVSQLLEVTMRMGLNLQTHTLVTTVSTTGDGYHIIETSRGQILARKVIFATNAYTAAILPQYEETIIPRKHTAAYVVPGSDVETPAYLDHTFGVTYRPGRRDHMVQLPQGGIIIGGAKEKFIHDRSLWWNVVDDSTLFNKGEKEYFAEIVEKSFLGWKNSNAKTEMIWTGSKNRS